MSFVNSDIMANKLTPEELDRLIDLSFAAKEHSHSPYSKFRVGASLLTSSGVYVTGNSINILTASDLRKDVM